MSVGTLHTQIVLDEPAKVHCGPSDPVSGVVKIRYRPGQKNVGAELFGPLTVSIFLHGRAKTKVWKSNGQTTSVYRGRAPLFSQKVLVYNDSFRVQPGELTVFPFTAFFPETAYAAVMDDFNEDPRFICHPNQPLPPSFQSSYRGFANRYEAFVEYRVGVDVDMPRLQVDVLKPTKYAEPVVYYERPRHSRPTSPKPSDWRGYVSVRNELLLPESERPAGFRQKTKALFGAGHFPIYAFDWSCLAPTQVHIGQPMCFEVNIKPRENESTAALIPQVQLKHFQIEISAHTQVRAHTSIFRSPGAEGNYTVCQMMGVKDSNEPFSKANDNTKIINTEPLGTRSRVGLFATSFATYNISHAYSCKISFAFQLTDKMKYVDKEFLLTVLPPLETAPPPPPAVAGPSSAPPQPEDIENKESELPRYEPAPPYEKESTGDK
ncbi:hypothetical protein F5Y03DRAFT_363742 [Xylaria venustula]|nr:hypothetical protein F5Y03DRAFT_363742 [Xylaria venustula]